MNERLTPAALTIVNWLGAVGPRWGLPGPACRIHALLYLAARPIQAASIAQLLNLGDDELSEGLAWLVAEALAEEAPAGWRADVDPWELMLKSLDRRRAREIAEARAVIEEWNRDHRDEHPAVVQQANRLFALVEDIGALDTGARALSPTTIRRLVGLGGRAARLLDRANGRRRYR